MLYIPDIEPKILWKYFQEISAIPRCSKHDEKIREYIKGFARKQKLEFTEDKVGNILIRKPASKNTLNLPVVILQAHLDMVCEKNEGIIHDFSRDPIVLKREDDYISAVDTSLGADNGIGVASMLAILDSREITHPPLEFLFTVDEESGFTGIFGIERDFLKGRIMVNLDGEEDENIYIGCAGGVNTFLKLPLKFKTEKLIEKNEYLISVSGLRGGHSGIDIHLGRANAIKLLAMVVWNLSEKFDFELVKIDGRGKSNAIPREAKATVLIRGSNIERIKSQLKMLTEKLSLEFKSVDPGLKINITRVESDSASEQVMDSISKEKVLSLLMSLPDGVIKMCPDGDIVETSTNLANVRTEFEEENRGRLSTLLMSRSLRSNELKDIRDKIKEIGKRAGTQVEEGMVYPEWEPRKESHLLNLAKKVYNDLFGKMPFTRVVHAGLECGVIAQKFPEMDIISIGPLIEHPHSPRERVKISSVSKYFEFLKGILSELSKRRFKEAADEN